MSRELFELNLMLVLGHTILFETKQDLVPDGVIDDAVGEDSTAPSPGKGTSRVMGAVQSQLPNYTNAQLAQLEPIEAAKLKAAQALSPEYNNLQTSLYSQNLPGLATTTAQAEDIKRQAAAATDTNILSSQGVPLASAYRAADSALNPEWYSARQSLGGSLGQLLDSLNLNAPNVEAERLVNQESLRSGNASTPSSTNTVANALSFGSEGMKRQNQLANALQIGSSMLPNMKSSFDPAANALVRSAGDTGASQFGGVREAGNEAFQSGQDVLNAAGGFQTTGMGVNAQKRDTLDRAGETADSFGGLAPLALAAS